jgi:hypothetical protein
MVRKLYEYFRQFFIKSMKYVKYYIMLVYMDPKISRDINLYGLLIWLVLFWILIPFKLVKQYPIVLVGYVYTIFILLTNYLLIGNDDVAAEDEQDFKNNSAILARLINDKAMQVSTAIFALAVATNTIFKKYFYREILLLIIYTLIFGVGFILPIYFVSNFKDSNTVAGINQILMRLRNVSLSYCVGFLVCGLMITIHRLFQLHK